MRACAAMPGGAALYRLLQRRYGRLDVSPLPRYETQAHMARWIAAHGGRVEGGHVLECGTGFRPLAPIGFFLAGAASVTTVDIARHLDLELTRRALAWTATHGDEVEAVYAGLVEPAGLRERLRLVERWRAEPATFLRQAGIHYLAPVDAAALPLPDNGIDYYITVSTLEHIPPPDLHTVLAEGRRVTRVGGMFLHVVDLSDHFQHHDASISRINFLRYSEAEWRRLAGNPLAYCNRLRVSDYLTLFEKLGLRTLEIEAEVDEAACGLLADGFPLDAAYEGYEPRDLCAAQMRVMLRA